MPADPFDAVLDLEDRFYQQGYQQGLQDGAQAGRIEGRCFGMQKGFDKFLESGRLASKAVVWANRLPQNLNDQPAAEAEAEGKRCMLPSLASNPRLDKNVKTLYALVEPDTMSTENTDEAVQDFDDRVKRAQGKARVIERMVG
ncbi:hypothetical protein HRG_009369 [Hirsutella rhossiliensis]|uniref:Essential protein Yae1 N-terminal domain-containing protein n=1 Tax=Hirsutella rhossiliensis TaxID=111463 RepID=A0A9P8MR72_9HYPO|nr:uncharacterized protein HRG_09369 [Hirsutella rhossiliensis]KAH0959587.1 hypothetical protein HRG_09369 [Hirsutella rhossiliensis]